MPIVTLESKSATLVSGSGQSRFRRRDPHAAVIMNVQLSRRAGVWLESEERLFVGDLSLSIREASSERVQSVFDLTRGIEGSPDKGQVVGSMTYSAAREPSESGTAQRPAILFEVFVPANVLASLVKLSGSGRYPRKVWVDVKGLGYRHERAGEPAMLSWPGNAEQSVLPITHSSFEVPLHAQREFTLGVAQPGQEASQPAQKRAAKAIERMLEPIFVRMSIRLAWVVWILLAIVVGSAIWILR